MSAESAYAFRHVVLRDAAYQLILPSDRAALHLEAFESLHLHVPAHEQRLHAAELLQHLRQGTGEKMTPAQARLELEYLQQAAERAGDSWQGAAALEWYEQLAGHPLADSALRLRATRRRASLLFRFGRGTEAAKLLETHRSAAAELGSSEEAGLLAALGSIYMQSGRADEAAPLLDRAIEMHRINGDERELGQTLTHRAILLRHTGEGESGEMLEQALKLNLSGGDEIDAGKTLTALGGLHRHHDRHEQSLECYERALDIFRRVGARLDEAQCLGNLANVYLQLDRLDAAEAAYLRALRWLRELGHRRSEALTLGNLGQLLWLRGRIGQSVTAQREAVRIFEEVNDLMLLPAFKAMLAGKLTVLGELDDAEQVLEDAQTLANAQKYAIATVDYLLPALLGYHVARCCGAYGRSAPPPDPSALKDIEDVYHRMKQTSKEAPEATVVMTRAMGRHLKRVIAAQRFTKEGGAPGIFNGLAPADESPALRRALLARLEAQAPTALLRLKTNDPGLYAEWTNQDPETPEPDWRSEELPR